MERNNDNQNSEIHEESSRVSNVMGLEFCDGIDDMINNEKQI